MLGDHAGRLRRAHRRRREVAAVPAGGGVLAAQDVEGADPDVESAPTPPSSRRLLRLRPPPSPSGPRRSGLGFALCESCATSTRGCVVPRRTVDSRWARRVGVCRDLRGQTVHRGGQVLRVATTDEGRRPRQRSPAPRSRRRGSPRARRQAAQGAPRRRAGASCPPVGVAMTPRKTNMMTLPGPIRRQCGAGPIRRARRSEACPCVHALHGLDGQGLAGERAVLRRREPGLRRRPHVRLPRRPAGARQQEVGGLPRRPSAGHVHPDHAQGPGGRTTARPA